MNGDGNSADMGYTLRMLSGGTAEEFELWKCLRQAFEMSSVQERKKGIDAYLNLIAGYSDFRLSLSLLRITEMRDSLKGEDWLLSERLVSDLLQEMSDRDDKIAATKPKKSDAEDAKETQGVLAKVIDLSRRFKKPS